MFNIPVRLDGVEKRKKSTGLFHIIAGFFLIGNAGSNLNQIGFKIIWPILPVYGVAMISIVYGIFRTKIDPHANYNLLVRSMQMITFLILGFVFLSFANTIAIVSLFLWSLIVFLLMRTEKKVFSRVEIRLTEEGILIPGFFSDHRLPWNLVQHFVVRKDYVTITRTNQHYVQLEVLKPFDDADINNMNAYSERQIELQNKMNKAE